MFTPFRKTEARSSVSMGEASPQCLMRSRMFQRGVRAVGVDGLEALRLHLPAGEVGVRLQPEADLADQVLDEPRARPGALGDVLLVRTLEQRVEIAARRI